MESLLAAGRVAAARAVSPQMLDGVLILLAVEYAILFPLLRHRGASILIAPIGWFLAAGAALIFAVRMALSDAPAAMVGAALAVGFVCHAQVLLWTLRRGPGLKGPK